MKHFDVFNGDADGICALHQLRLASPLESVLITGVKRDIVLLARVSAQAGDALTVLDISLDENRHALSALLRRGVTAEYFDHHFSGMIPQHPNLRVHIDTSPDVCTSILVDRHLSGKYRLWAIVATFGDNLPSQAEGLAHRCGLQPVQIRQLQQLGESMNYNAYGDTEADLLIRPAVLYQALRPYQNPFDFIAAEPVLRALTEGRRQDMAMAMKLKAETLLPGGAIFVLPNQAWARRVRGSFANYLAGSAVDRAHAVLCEDAQGDYTVSVRAAFAAPYGADRLCRRFSGGGGRALAAGIDHLSRDQIPALLRAFAEEFRGDGSFGAG